MSSHLTLCCLLPCLCWGLSFVSYLSDASSSPCWLLGDLLLELPPHPATLQAQRDAQPGLSPHCLP